MDSFHEGYFPWDRPRLEAVWLILKTVTPRESDIEWIKNAGMDRIAGDIIEVTDGKHTIHIKLNDTEDTLTFEIDGKKTLDFDAERVGNGLKIYLPIQRPEYPYPDKRRKYYRVKRSIGANNSEPIKSDIIEKITREDELYFGLRLRNSTCLLCTVISIVINLPCFSGLV